MIARTALPNKGRTVVASRLTGHNPLAKDRLSGKFKCKQLVKTLLEQVRLLDYDSTPCLTGKGSSAQAARPSFPTAAA
jgi:hypothetical protein